MGTSQADKQANHTKIVKIAAERFRAQGVDGIGVADLMKEAGLTHGGFYAHFKSRNQLVKEAIEEAADQSYEGMITLASAKGEPSYDTYVEGYLSQTHKEATATGCSTAALISEMGRCDGESREAYTAKCERSLEYLSSLLNHLEPSEARRKALTTVATLAGALAMARAVTDEALSQEILTAAEQSLKELAGR